MPALDGLRGMAALIVFLSHTSLSGHRALPFLDFSGAGKSGVVLFFVLSSFLLSGPFLLHAQVAFERRRLVRFFVRRVFRIYPLLLVYLLVALCTSALFTVLWGEAGAGIPFYLNLETFLESLLMQTGKGVTWSILVEVKYYFLLPVIAYAYSILLQGKFWRSALVTASLVVVAHSLNPSGSVRSNDPRLLPYAAVMLTGTLLAVYQYNFARSGRARRWIPTLYEAVGLVSLLVLVLTVPSVWFATLGGGDLTPPSARATAGAEWFKVFHGRMAGFAPLWAGVLLGVVNGKGLLQWMFDRGPLRYLGKISFSFYLWHPCVLMVLRNTELGLPDAAVFWLMFCLTVALAHTSYRLIEGPGERAGLALIAKLSAPISDGGREQS